MPLTLATTTPGEAEIFVSIQGEGPSMGQPVAFIRLSRCNLACVWCDTAYTWHFEGDERPHNDGEVFERKANQITTSAQDAAALVANLGQNRLVITGGEPLLQGGALADMLEHLPDIAVEVETNGTAMPPARLDVRVDQYNVSPKLAHSGNAAQLALIPQMLEFWAADPRAFFKFVIAQPEDVEQVVELAAKHRIPAQRTYLMPEGTDSTAVRERSRWLSPICLKHGYRLSDRQHIHLFGDTRGT